MSNYFMGIDASKGFADFFVLDAQRKPMDAGFQLDDTAAGHRELMAYLQNLFARLPDATLDVAIESTGGYENNWYNRLRASAETLPIHVARLNPAWVKANSEASGQRNKTDQVSAQDIAEYQIAHPEKVAYDEETYPSLRRQWTLIKMYVKQKQQLLNELESQLYSSMPELLTFCRQGVPLWLLNLLRRYPSYQHLLGAGVDGLSQIAYVSRQKAQRVIALVEQGIGTCDRVTAQILNSLASQILQAERLIQQQKRLLEKNCQEAKDAIELLLSFKGIGVYSAVGLLLNITDIRRFPTAKHLASYFGLHPVYKQSGDGLWGMHMSKKGRSEPRAILYMVAFSAIQHNPLIHELYVRCLAKGMHKSAAMGVCMHKILRIIFGMLKNNTPFDPNVDRHNRDKYRLSNQKKVTPKTRRLQAFDENAPTSRRQHKKRKEQTRSQDEMIVAYGIAESAPSSLLKGVSKI